MERRSPRPWRLRLGLFLAGAAVATAVSAATLQPGDDPAASAVWQKVQASLLGGRAVLPAPPGMLELEAPGRAIDAAVVPVAIRAHWPQTGAVHVRRLYLVIDANPSPLSGIFEFTPDSGRAEVETRVRVDAYTHMRAIAELSDGRLFAVTRFVKASGGCSAPAGGDAQAALATLGQVHFRVDAEGASPGQPMRVQLAVDHPNHSGLAMDQFSRQFTPAHFVRKVDVTYGGRAVFSADVDFSISENPNFRFYVKPQRGAELRATVVDSQNRQFAGALRADDAVR